MRSTRPRRAISLTYPKELKIFLWAADISFINDGVTHYQDCRRNAFALIMARHASCLHAGLHVDARPAYRLPRRERQQFSRLYILLQVRLSKTSSARTGTGASIPQTRWLSVVERVLVVAWIRNAKRVQRKPTGILQELAPRRSAR